MIRCLLLPGLFSVCAGTATFARIGDTADQLSSQFGPPSKEFVDREGTGIRLYQTPEFSTIKVEFVRGKSHCEVYVPLGDAISPTLVETVKRQNPGEEVDVREKMVRIGDWERAELKFVNGSRRRATYQGIAHCRVEANTRIVVVTGTKQPWLGMWVRPILGPGEPVVVEIWLNQSDPALGSIRPGTQVEVTVLDALPDDLNAQLAVIGRREHLDWEDASGDAHDRLAELIQVTSDGQIVYDRAICGVHHIAMQQRKVDIAYGLLVYSSAERYCQQHYPNYRDYASGGCVVSDESPKFTQIYICQKCVAECDEYKRQHPNEAKNPLD